MSNKIKIKFILFIFFSLLFYGILIHSFYDVAKNGVDTHKSNLVSQAESHYHDIMNIYKWSGELGGIYAYGHDYKANQYMNNNTIKDANGRKLIRINSSWLIRMLSEHSNSPYYRFSLKSNNPINPLNKAKGFYADSLKEISQKYDISNTKRYRFVKEGKKFEYLHGIYIKKSCLSCHQNENKHIGDLKAGVAIEIDAKSYFNRKNEIWNEFYHISTAVTVLFILLIILVYKLFRRSAEIEMLNKKLEEKVIEKTIQLNNALQGANLGYWNWNVQTNEYQVDDRWLSMLGLKQSELNKDVDDWKKRIHPNDIEQVEEVIRNAMFEHQPYVVDFRMRHKRGHYVWIEGAGSVISYDENNKPLELAGTHQDITQRKELEKELTQNSVYLNNLFDKNPNIILITDGKKIIKTNQAFFNLFKEYNNLDTFLKEHKCICEFFESEDGEDFISNDNTKWLKDAFEKEEPVAKIVYTGNTHYFAVQTKKIYESYTMHYMITLSDITETYNLKKEYEKLSITDALTLLYNRRYFNKIFTQEINRASRLKHSFTFLIMDIDYFKRYNDNYGHDKGDVLLKTLAESLKKSLKRSNEFVFRIGGEEFGIIYSELYKEDSIAHAEEILQNIQELKLEHKYNPPLNVITVSIGHFYMEDSGLFEAKTIYHNADKALYYAKEHGRNRVADYDLVIKL